MMKKIMGENKKLFEKYKEGYITGYADACKKAAANSRKTKKRGINMNDNIFEKLTPEEQSNLWLYLIFNRDMIVEKTEQWTKEAEKAGMTLAEYLESISPLNDKGKPSWLGKNCKDCGNKKCKELGELPKGYDCALWQPESEK